MNTNKLFINENNNIITIFTPNNIGKKYKKVNESWPNKESLILNPDFTDFKNEITYNMCIDKYMMYVEQLITDTFKECSVDEIYSVLEYIEDWATKNIKNQLYNINI